MQKKRNDKHLHVNLCAVIEMPFHRIRSKTTSLQERKRCYMTSRFVQNGQNRVGAVLQILHLDILMCTKLFLQVPYNYKRIYRKFLVCVHSSQIRYCFLYVLDINSWIRTNRVSQISRICNLNKKIGFSEFMLFSSN